MEVAIVAAQLDGARVGVGGVGGLALLQELVAQHAQHARVAHAAAHCCLVRVGGGVGLALRRVHLSECQPGLRVRAVEIDGALEGLLGLGQISGERQLLPQFEVSGGEARVDLDRVAVGLDSVVALARVGVHAAQLN